MMILPVLTVAALIIGAIILFRHVFVPRDSGPLTPLEVLRERYARGEINREQFEDMRGTLNR